MDRYRYTSGGGLYIGLGMGYQGAGKGSGGAHSEGCILRFLKIPIGHAGSS